VAGGPDLIMTTKHNTQVAVLETKRHQRKLTF